MKTYIATSIARVKDQQELAQALAGLGVSLTFDWTRNGTLAGRPHDVVAHAEISGVVESDFVVVLLPGGRGTHAELGAALASGKTVFIHAADAAMLLGADTYTCVFYSHPLVKLVIGSRDDLLISISSYLNP